MRIETNFTTTLKDIYLCYMTPDNKLNIISDQELSLKNFESNIRRFYIVGENLFNTLFYVKICTTDFNKYGYNVLIQTNKTTSKLTDFKYTFSSFIIDNDNPPIFENAIPLDILITSLNDNELNSNLKISVERKQFELELT